MEVYETMVPRDEKVFRVTIAFVEAYAKPHPAESSLVYMNRVRIAPSAVARTDLASRYGRDLPMHRLNFRRVLEQLTDVTTVIGVPSDQPFVNDFLPEALAAFPRAVNLSSYFTKPSGANVGRAKSLAEAKTIIQHSLPPNVNVPSGAILIVDDVLADGRTAAAILSHMKDHGIERKTYVAAPLASTREGPLPKLAA